MIVPPTGHSGEHLKGSTFEKETADATALTTVGHLCCLTVLGDQGPF